MNVIGEVRGKRAIIVDDEIDTAGTLIEIVRALEREGVTEIYACATHGVLSRSGRRPHPRLEPQGGRPHRHGAAAAGEADQQDQDALDRAAHRRGDQAHPPRRIGRAPCSSARSSLTQELLLWEDGDRAHARHPRR